MAFKFIILSALVAYVSAGIVGYHGYPGYAAPLPLAYHAAAPLAYKAYPAAYPAPAPLVHAAPVAAVRAAPAIGAAVPVAEAVVAKTVDTEYDANPQYSFSYDVADSLTGDFKAQSETRNGDVVVGQYSLVDPDGTQRIVDYTADDVNGFNAVVRKEPLAAKVALPVAAPAAYAAAPIAPIAKVALPAAHAYPYITKAIHAY
ncbi:hypothetical protein QAD02_018936 [Eretmocerus hayati]|uniref:Uncharacterized protein n=1 Tax=Eretmocerus hayati TaxID=131215 RepID=A0ACC2PIM4_9HYME|nr:hypothetical protein QAD02_018936 [Eretmocerus hayati]